MVEAVSKKYTTYCTICQANVSLSDIKYIKLANSMAIIEGYCIECKIKLTKGKIMPRAGKNPLLKSKRKSKRKKLSIYNLSNQKK